MSNWLLATVSVAYLWTAWEYMGSKQLGMGIAFVAYAMANLGFIVANWEKLR